MNVIQKSNAMGAQSMTSLEIAQVTGKMHKDVMHEAEQIIGRTLVSFNQNADGCITASDIAEALGMEVKDLNSFLTDKKVQKWQRGQYRLTPEYEGLGLAQDRLFIYYSKDGKQKERTYLVWTTKGAEMIDKMIFENRF